MTVRDRNLVKTGILCLLAGLFSFLYFVVRDGGTFTLLQDFNAQQIPFAEAAGLALKAEHPGGWVWTLDLGSPLVQGFSFYNLGSPFYWLSLLFPAKLFPYLTAGGFLLKYTAAGVCAYLYLRRFVKDARCAVAGGLLYAFSGFQSMNILFFHFHDATCFFPLLLLGLERLMEHREREESHGLRTAGAGLFVFAVFLNCLINYYFFFIEAVFLVLYYCFRFFPERKASDTRLYSAGSQNGVREPATGGFPAFASGAASCLLYGILGVGCAAVLFLPNAVYMLSSAGISAAERRFPLLPDREQLLFLLRGMLLPPEAMSDFAAILDDNWDSTSLYLPFFGLSGVIALVSRYGKTFRQGKTKQSADAADSAPFAGGGVRLTGAGDGPGSSACFRKRLTCFLLLLFVISFSPLLTAGFYLFQFYHQRFWFTLLMMMILATVCVLDDGDLSGLRFGAAVHAALAAGFVAVVWLMAGSGAALIRHPVRFLLLGAVPFLSCAGWMLLTRHGNRGTHDEPQQDAHGGISHTPHGKAKHTPHHVPYSRILAAVVFFSVLTTFSTIWVYKNNTSPEAYLQSLAVGARLRTIDPQYRYRLIENSMTLSGEAAGMSSFTSTVSHALSRFDALFDHTFRLRRVDKASVPGLAELCAGKYTVLEERGDGTYTECGNTTGGAEPLVLEALPPDEEIADRFTVDGKSYVVTAKSACPIGFSVSQLLMRSELMSLPKEQRGIALLFAAVVDPARMDDEMLWQLREATADAGADGGILQRLQGGADPGALVREAVEEAGRNRVLDFTRDGTGFSCRTGYAENRLVFFSVASDSGWQATIDGNRVPVIDACGMSALVVPAGEHAIRFVYRTPFLRAGMVISVLSAVLAFCVIKSCNENRLDKPGKSV